MDRNDWTGPFSKLSEHFRLSGCKWLARVSFIFFFFFFPKYSDASGTCFAAIARSNGRDRTGPVSSADQLFGLQDYNIFMLTTGHRHKVNNVWRLFVDTVKLILRYNNRPGPTAINVRVRSPDGQFGPYYYYYYIVCGWVYICSANFQVVVYNSQRVSVYYYYFIFFFRTHHTHATIMFAIS